MLENRFKTRLCRKLRDLFPGCVILHPSPNETQGIPDLVVLYGNRWAALEGKQSPTSLHRPNQQYYVEKMNQMSFAAFIYPENEEEVLHGLQQTFGP